jgi:hypothetical protein
MKGSGWFLMTTPASFKRFTSLSKFSTQRQTIVAGAMQIGGVGVFEDGWVHVMKQLNFSEEWNLQRQGNVSGFDIFIPMYGKSLARDDRIDFVFKSQEGEKFSGGFHVLTTSVT